jgi:hypothetical protein
VLPFQVGTGIFFHAVHPSSGTNPASYSMEIRDFCVGKSGRVPTVNHSHSSHANVNNEWTYTSNLTYTFTRRNREMKSNFL